MKFKYYIFLLLLSTGCSTVSVDKTPDFVKDGRRIANHEHCTKPYIVVVHDNNNKTHHYFCAKANSFEGTSCVHQEWTYEDQMDYNQHHFKNVFWMGSVVEVREELDCLPVPKLFP